MVYVLNIHGQPLMPTKRFGMVRHLLENGQAIVVNRTPFTIQLLYETTNYTQPITLAIDAGSKTIGVSASTNQQEVYAAEVEIRNDITKELTRRREYRRARRNRKTRYRKPRFNNRKKTKKKGWVAPSIRHKINCHLRIVREIRKILPITNIIVEVASFDIQKINSPEINGKEYQEGDQMGFWNVREYVLHRDGHRCHGKSGCKNKIIGVHHIKRRIDGGSDAPNNLISLCDDCHTGYHQGKVKLNFKPGKSFKDAVFMGIMRWSFYNALKEEHNDIEVGLTYGYITKNTRITNGIEKSHINDAFCIANNLNATRSTEYYLQKFVRKNNRRLHKDKIAKGGKRKANKSKNIIFGYKLFDKVKYDGQECFIFGKRTSGYFDLRLLDGTSIKNSVNYKEITRVESANTLLTERRLRNSSTPLKGSSFLA